MLFYRTIFQGSSKGVADTHPNPLILTAKSIFLIPDCGRLECGLPIFSETIDMVRYIANREKVFKSQN